MRWLGLLSLLFISGCAYRVLTNDELSAMRPGMRAQPSIVLAVRETAPDNNKYEGAQYPWFKGPQYVLLVESLRSSGLFKEVDIEGHTKEPPQFVLDVTSLAHGENDNALCGEGLIWPIFTLGIIPWTCHFDIVASYRVIDSANGHLTDLETMQPTRYWAGLISYPLRASDSWEGKYDYHKFYEMVAFKAYAVMQQEQ